MGVRITVEFYLFMFWGVCISILLIYLFKENNKKILLLLFLFFW